MVILLYPYMYICFHISQYMEDGMKFDVPENFKPTRFNQVYLTNICIAMLTLVLAGILSTYKLEGIQLANYESFAFFAWVLTISVLFVNENYYKAQLKKGRIYERAFAPKQNVKFEPTPLKLIFVILFLLIPFVTGFISESPTNYYLLAFYGCTGLVFTIACGLAISRHRAFVKAENPERRPLPLNSPIVLFEVAVYLSYIAAFIWMLAYGYFNPYKLNLTMSSIGAAVAVFIVYSSINFAIWYINTATDDIALRRLKDRHELDRLEKAARFGLILAVVGLFIPTMQGFQFSWMGWLMILFLTSVIVFLSQVLHQVPRYIRRIDEEKGTE